MTTATEIQATTPAQGAETVTPAAEGANPAAVAETTEQVELESADSGEDDSTETEGEDDKTANRLEKTVGKLQRRNERLLQDRARERTQREAAEAKLAAIEARATAGEDGTKPKPEDVDALVDAKAKTLRVVERTTEATAKLMKEAGAKYGTKEFEAVVAELVYEIGPQIDQDGRPSPLMEAVLDSDRAVEVMHYLGSNTEVAAELTGLSPARLGRRIAQIESDLAAKAKPKPSAAAKPLTPVKPAAVPTVDPAKQTDAQWRAEARKARMSR